MLLPFSLTAQVTVEDRNKKTVTEETETPDGKIITTTTFEKQAVFTNGLWFNWELTADIGPHLYYGDNDWKVNRKWEMIAFPVIDVDLTKWISPSFGIGFAVSTGRFKGLYQSSEKAWGDKSVGANFQTGILYDKADPKYDYQLLALQRGWFTDVYGVFHIDFCSLFGGYNPDRFYTADAYLGGGIMMGHDSNGFLPSAAANFGINNKFRLTENLRLSVNVRGALVADDFDGELYVQEPTKAHWDANHKMDGNFGITVGLSVNLGKERSKWRPASRTSIYQYNNVVKVPENNVAPVKEIERVVDTVLVSNVPEVWFHINFIIDRWDILSREMVNLHAVSDLIKSTPDVRYLICGYADKQTATPEHNLMLSENRCKAVYDVLVNTFGVNPDQLVQDYKGGVDYMFYGEKELSRCVMITAIHEE